MPLLAFNLTGANVTLDAGNPAPTLPLSADPPNRGPAYNVTTELRPDVGTDPVNGVTGGLDAAAYALLQLQVDAGDIDFEWTDVNPEYLTPGLTIGGSSPGAHAASHLPSGGDPLTTAIAGAIAIGDAAAIGSAESFARSDHTHSLTAPAAPADIGSAGAAGSATEPARADHVHGFGTGFSLVQVHKTTVAFGDLTAAAAFEAVPLTGFPANAIILAAWVELDTLFSGGAATAVTVEIGDSTDPNEYMTATDVFAGAGIKAPTELAVGHWAGLFKAAYSPEALITATTDTVDNLAAGSMVVNIVYIQFILDTP